MSIETGLCSHTRALRGALGVSIDTKCSYSEYLFSFDFPARKPDTLLFADVGTATIAKMELSLHSGRVKDSAWLVTYTNPSQKFVGRGPWLMLEYLVSHRESGSRHDRRRDKYPRLAGTGESVPFQNQTWLLKYLDFSLLSRAAIPASYPISIYTTFIPVIPCRPFLRSTWICTTDATSCL